MGRGPPEKVERPFRMLCRLLVIFTLLTSGAYAQTSVFLNLNRNQVMGGSTLSGMVALSNPAPADGAVVSLSGGPGISLPPSVTVPAGMTSAPFDISTFPSQGSQSVRISASYGSSQKVAYLQVLATPAPAQQPAQTYVPSGSSNNNSNPWGAKQEITSDLNAEESWNYAAPYQPYGGYGGYWGAYGATRGYGVGRGPVYSGGGYRR